MSIIGESLQPYVINQINARQRLHGSGAGTANVNSPSLRSDQQINLLNSNTSWIKLASGVSISADRLADIGLNSSYQGMELAKKYILFAGFSKLEEDGSDRLVQRQGFLPQDPNSSYTYGTYGYSPMPGITDADIKSLNRGSLKKATVRLKVHNKQQFDIIDLLYLRLGYTVLLEWGNSIYTPNGVARETVRNTILEDPYRFFNSGYSKGKSYLDILPVIEYYRRQYEGNYDGLLGKVSNFSWSFQPDGSYDIELTIISLGDVVESLKSNISSNKQLSQFILDALSFSPPPSENEEGEENNIIEENADSNDIAAMLFTWKFTNRDKLQYESNEDSIFIERPDDAEPRFMGAFLEPNATATLTQIPIEFFVVDEAGVKIYPNFSQDKYYGPPNFEVQYFDSIATPDIEKEAERIKEEKVSKMKDDSKRYSNDTSFGTFLDVEYKIKSPKKSSIVSPLIGFSKKDACFINTEPDKQFYLRFGALLNYVENNILPKIDTKDPSTHNEKPPIFNINNDIYGTGTKGNYMYSLPNQVSLDPRVCIVRNDNFQTTSGITKVYTNLSPFKADDYVKNNPNPNKAYIMNVYLNFEFIINCINDNSDEKGDIGIFGFLKAICDGLNKSLGGINNLEPVINETNNTLSILETTPIPGLNKKDSSYVLQLYGYEKINNGYISNFVRKVDLKTAITPEYATMITVGATAGGYVKGTESTAFSKWNVGLTDRFQEKFIPGNENSSEEGGEDEAAVNYTNKFLSAKAGSASRYGFKGNIISDNAKNLQIDPGAIEKNVSVVTEYYKYLIASQKNKSGGTIGFIPFKISFTMDGISGIKIYNKLQVDTRFLPKAYGDNLDLIVTGVSHKLANSDWETDIEATVIPKTEGTSEVFITSAAVTENIQTVKSSPGAKKKGKDIVPKDPNKLCGLANAKNVNQIYPKSVKWNGTAKVIVDPSTPPTFKVNLSKQPVVAYSKTLVTPNQYVKNAENIIDKLAPSAKNSYKKAILISAFAISRQEQGGPNGGFKGFNNNIAGIEASGFSVYSASDVIGKVKLSEGGTGKTKEYYAFKDIGAGLVPLLSKIMDRNMWATGGTANEFAWRYFRDWNGYGARTTKSYATHMDDCIIISNLESIYRSSIAQINNFSKYR